MTTEKKTDGLIGETLAEAHAATAKPAAPQLRAICWGKRVDREFKVRLLDGCTEHGLDPDKLMACMAFETGETFRPDIRNAAGSGAVGLIQFMPQTAAVLGTSTNELAKMPAFVQLEYVFLYFKPWARKVETIGDYYSVILWPRAVGKPADYVLWRRDDPRSPRVYAQNKGLDYDRNGQVTKAEITAKVKAKLERGMLPGNFG